MLPALDQTQSPLFRLPPELRNAIYEYAALDYVKEWHGENTKARVVLETNPRTWWSCGHVPALLLVCQRVRREAAAPLCHNVSIRVGEPGAGTKIHHRAMAVHHAYTHAHAGGGRLEPALLREVWIAFDSRFCVNRFAVRLRDFFTVGGDYEDGSDDDGDDDGEGGQHLRRVHLHWKFGPPHRRDELLLLTRGIPWDVDCYVEFLARLRNLGWLELTGDYDRDVVPALFEKELGPRVTVVASGPEDPLEER